MKDIYTTKLVKIKSFRVLYNWKIVFKLRIRYFPPQDKKKPETWAYEMLIAKSKTLIHGHKRVKLFYPDGTLDKIINEWDDIADLDLYILDPRSLV